MDRAFVNLLPTHNLMDHKRKQMELCEDNKLCGAYLADPIGWTNHPDALPMGGSGPIGFACAWRTAHLGCIYRCFCARYEMWEMILEKIKDIAEGLSCDPDFWRRWKEYKSDYTTQGEPEFWNLRHDMEELECMMLGTVAEKPDSHLHQNPEEIEKLGTFVHSYFIALKGAHGYTSESNPITGILNSAIDDWVQEFASANCLK